MSQIITNQSIAGMGNVQYDTYLRTGSANYYSKITSLPDSAIEIVKNRVVIYDTETNCDKTEIITDD